MGLAAAFFVVVNGLGLSVIVLNRPKWAVPPSMRDQIPWITNLDSY